MTAFRPAVLVLCAALLAPLTGVALAQTDPAQAGTSGVAVSPTSNPTAPVDIPIPTPTVSVTVPTPTKTSAPTPAPTQTPAPTTAPTAPATAAPDPAPAPVPTETAPAPTPTVERPPAEPPAPDIPQAKSPAEAPLPGLWGVDVSKWQHPGGQAIDWTALAASHGGMSYAFIKGTEGNDGIPNPYLARDLTAARGTGIAVGVYHYARPSAPVVEDAVAEARAAFAAAGAPGEGQLPLVLDLESNGQKLTPDEVAQWALTWLEEVERLSGRKPILYTYPHFFRDNVTPDLKFAAYPLWIANYGLERIQPYVPEPWTSWTFWQYSAKGVGLPGMAPGTEMDLNVYTGSQAELDLLAGRTPRGADGQPLSLQAGLGLMGNALLTELTADREPAQK